MKKIFLVIVSAAVALSVSAGETPKKPSCAGFVTNRFWDNWELSAGIGVGTAVSADKNLGPFGSRIGFEGNFSALKWLSPVTGVRLQLQGGRFVNFDSEAGKIKWPYLFAHSDLMINFSNWVGGYREDRAYYAVPFVGFGYFTSNFTDKMHRQYDVSTSHDLGVAYGILNKFRMSPSVDFNIELKGILVRSQVCPAKMNGGYLHGFSATAGFTYRFNKRGWQRGVAGYTAKDIRAFQDAVAAGNSALEKAQAENDALNRKLADAQSAVAAANEAAAKARAEAEAAAANAKTSAESLILYNIGESTLTSQEKTRLDLLADLIKSGPKDKVYNIEGYADRQTGTAAGNMRLSQSRAKRAYDYLVGKGVNPEQLTWTGKGDTVNPFPVQKANRSAVIK